MTTPMGYEMKSTFVTDFTIADMFGVNAIKDTYNRAFEEWKDNYVYLTELVIALNWKIFEWFNKNDEIAKLYDELWRKTDEYAVNNLNSEELKFFFRVTD